MKTDDFVLESRQPKTEPLGGGSGTGGLHNRSLVGLVSLCALTVHMCVCVCVQDRSLVSLSVCV